MPPDQCAVLLTDLRVDFKVALFRGHFDLEPTRHAPRRSLVDQIRAQGSGRRLGITCALRDQQLLILERTSDPRPGRRYSPI